MKRHWGSTEDDSENAKTSRRMDVNSEGRSNERRSDDPTLLSKHKIFLSHSGAQKDFAEQLCEDLERRQHFPFLDRRPSSLPKGERFPELILKAAFQCHMAVVVVSEEYFLSKWPMIELHAFMQSRLRSNTKLKILPLFYGLSVREFNSKERREQWFSKWEELAKTDTRININEWKESLMMMASFNGIEYNPSSSIGAYRKNIVLNICKEVIPDIKWNDSHVQGRSNLCQAICDRIQQTRPCQKYKVRVVGLYGVGGIGKTTICKTLCNELSQKFEGMVSHIEFGSKSHGEVLKVVLNDLTNTSRELLEETNEGECWHILERNLCEQKTFVAIDNIWDDSKLIDEAKMYLQAHVHEGHFNEKSVVMVTSRSLETLAYLGIEENDCFEMPELGHEDAKNLFLHHAAYGRQFSKYNDICAIEKCVALCYFRKGNNRLCHYLPLALKALGVQMGCVGNEPSHWVKALPHIRDFNYLQEEENPVFSIFRSSFDRLRPPDKNLFMDAVMYCPVPVPRYKLDLMEWLCLVYKQDLQEIESRLQRLKGKALLEDVDMTSRRISVHDLHREFAKLEARGKLNESADFDKRRWVYYKDTSPTELEMTPSHRCWQNLTRIGILESDHGLDQRDIVQSLQGIEWGYCSNVVVLKLVGLEKLRGDLNLKDLKCLRSLDIIDLNQLDSLDGLQDLNYLTYFRWIRCYGRTSTHMGQLPASLKVLYMRLGVLLRPDVFARCSNLRSLELTDYRAGNPDLNFSNCTSLQSVWLQDCHAAGNLHFSSCISLRSVTFHDCHAGNLDFSTWASLHSFSLRNSRAGDLDFRSCTSLHSFRLKDCRIGSLNFSNSTSVQSVTLEHCRAPGNLDFSYCTSLQSVKLSWVKLLKTLSGLSTASTSSLQSLIVSCCDDLVGIPGLGQLVGLQQLYLHHNLQFKKLPDLHELTRLQVLDISNMEIEEVPGLGCLHQLRELKWRCSVRWSFSDSSIKLPNLSGCKQLQVVDFKNNLALSSLEGVLEDLPALRCLDLSGCGSLFRLPDLSRSRNLEELGLHDSGVKIREEDIFWLATLPLLRPVPGWF